MNIISSTGLSVFGCLAFLHAASVQPELKRDTARQIAALLNDYRITNGMAPIPLSDALTKVAETHARDIASDPDGGAGTIRGYDVRGHPCNGHSWSGRGNWTAVCYTADHRYAQDMWNKPHQVTGGIYKAHGFEIGHYSGGHRQCPDCRSGMEEQFTS